MNIAIIAPEGSIHVQRCIRYCLQLGHDVFHIKRIKENNIPGVHEILLPQPCPTFPETELVTERQLLQDTPHHLFRDKLAYAARLKTYRDILKEIKPDVVHAHWLHPFGLHGLLAAKGIAPFVQSVWGSDVFLYPLMAREHFLLLQYVIANANMVLGNSRTLINTAFSFLDTHHQLHPTLPPTFVFKWGIEPVFNPLLYNKEKLRAQYHFNNDDVILLSVRGTRPVYNIRTIIRAFLQARHTYPQLKLILVGRGYGWEHCDVNNIEGVQVLDYTSHEKIAELMALSDISISIPFSDSMANTLVESLVMKLYLIVSALPAVKEFIQHDVHARFVNPHDVDDVTQAICLYFEDPATIKRMSNQSQALDREFSEEQAIQNVQHVYQSLQDQYAIGDTLSRPNTPH